MIHQLGGSIPPVSSKDLEDRTVKVNGCWEWVGHLNTNGYGIFHKNKKRIYVHRLMWMITNSEILDTKEFICHKCDNRKCINPKHLLVIHPPIKDEVRAFCEGDESWEPKSYFARNRDIVIVSNVILATPVTEFETKGGTWYTINHAKKLKKPLYIIYPSDRIEMFNLVR